MSTLESCEIRNALVGDAEAVSALGAELGYPVPPDVLRERIDRLSSEHSVLVAESAGKVIGWIDVGLFSHLLSGTRAEIGGLVVAEGSRSSGVGRKLLAQAEQWARDKGVKEVLVRSNSKRADAHRFYLRGRYTHIKTSAVFTKKL